MDEWMDGQMDGWIDGLNKMRIVIETVPLTSNERSNNKSTNMKKKA